MDYVNVEMDATDISKTLVEELAIHFGLFLTWMDENTIQVDGMEFCVDKFQQIIVDLL